MNKSLVCIALSALAAACSPGGILLDFEGLAPYPNGNDVAIGGFYSGGTSGAGVAGPNLGVAFSSNASLICLNTSVYCSNTSKGGQGSPTSQTGGLFFLSGNAVTMNVAAGFSGPLAFEYATAGIPGFASIYDGLDGSGVLLASLALTTYAPGCSVPSYASYCPFQSVTMGFNGQAKSVVFGGTANFIVFDDIAWGGGSGVPEPSSVLLSAAGLAMVACRWRRKQSS